MIDWPTAAWGPPGIDLARMRLNLVEEVDLASEARFLQAYHAVGGDPDDRHPYWDPPGRRRLSARRLVQE